MQTNISTTDITKYLGPNAKVMKYSELADYDDILEVLPSDKSYAIILIEESPNAGHWVCIMRYGDFIETFDSYGCHIDYEFKFINNCIRRLLGQTRHFLSELLAKCDSKKIIYNKKRFQGSESSTCGRHCIFRILMMKEFFYCLAEYQEFMKKRKDECGMTYDELICTFVK